MNQGTPSKKETHPKALIAATVATLQIEEKGKEVLVLSPTQQPLFSITEFTEADLKIFCGGNEDAEEKYRYLVGFQVAHEAAGFANGLGLTERESVFSTKEKAIEGCAVFLQDFFSLFPR